jgi:hypothetical protein
MHPKTLGIWMDHSTAILMEPDDPAATQTIDSAFGYTKADVLNRSDNHTLHKEPKLHEVYFQEIAIELVKYDRVLLFGPTNAKAEFRNYLDKDLRVKNVKIDVAPAGKITGLERLAFVKEYFENQ